MTASRSLELFFIDGTPEGMLTAEVFGWTGHVLRIPRMRLKDALSRPEAGFTGIYFLIGEKDGAPLAYIGEAESVAKRIKDHEAGRDWWTDAYVVTTSADVLHKAHARYLEARLLSMARDAAVMALDNKAAPEPTSLNEAARANMETFLETLRMILPAMGVSLFQSGKRLTQRRADTEGMAEPRFRMDTPKHGVSGTARLVGSDFIVEAGSIARRVWEGAGGHSYEALHRRLVNEGVLVQSDTTATFAQDYACRSPSAAAAVLNGRTANGRLDWRLVFDGRTYDDWERDELEATP